MADQGLQITIVGAGVGGLTAALALAQDGHRTTVVDRDDALPPAGAADSEAWVRRGVAQFQQPHAFLARLRQELEASLPAVVPALIADGAVDVPLPDGMSALWCRRSTLEWTLRRLAEENALITLLPATAQRIETDGQRVTGVRLGDGATQPADLVVDASGRRGKLSDAWSTTVVDGPCNEVYTSRRYRLLPGAEFGPVNRGVISVAEGDGYTFLIFPHDAGTFTATFTRLPEDHDLAELRHTDVFERALAQVPLGALWTDPERAEPISDVLVMSGLRNVFRPLDEDAPLGLETIGDTVSTGNPHFGRGSSLAATHALRLASAVVASPDDAAAWRQANREWTHGELRSWFDDGVELDETRAPIWRSLINPTPGGGRPPAGPGGLPRLFILAAAGADRQVGRTVMRHMHLMDSPDALTAVAPIVGGLVAQGWRPGMPPPGATQAPSPLMVAPRRSDLVRAATPLTASVA